MVTELGLQQLLREKIQVMLNKITLGSLVDNDLRASQAILNLQVALQGLDKK